MNTASTVFVSGVYVCRNAVTISGFRWLYVSCCV